MISLNPWAAFTGNQRAELFIALEHRLVEAEQGNAFVYWPIVGDLLLSLLNAESDADEDLDEIRERLTALEHPSDTVGHGVCPTCGRCRECRDADEVPTNPSPEDIS